VTAEALVIEFDVGVPPAQAFDAWTQRCAMWWPPSHTITGDPAAITFEPRPGGRIVEIAKDGGEHPWGEILEWEPPTRIRYLWHLFFDASEATEVEVTFMASDDHTWVRLEQRGWERLGAAGSARRTKTASVWEMLSAAYADALSGRGGVAAT
jgi:uncharacterized protein YndB with AHSA1/START domain